jgi:hypothetical protein
MISIPGVHLLENVVHNAQRTFIVVFPGSLRFFWITQMYEKYWQMVVREWACLVDVDSQGVESLAL